MPQTTYLATRHLDQLYGNQALTPPATWHFGVHIATALAAQANVGDPSISVNHAPPVGARLRISPLAGSPQVYTVGAVAGAGPYTVTLAAHAGGATTVQAQVATGGDDAYVEFDPAMDASGVIEPSGGAYARVAATNNATNFPAATADLPTGVLKSNGVQFDFAAPSALWGVATHLLWFDAATAGNLWRLDRLLTPRKIDAAATPLYIAVGDLDLHMRGWVYP